jgi:GDPmannose 4,6-dehydratase
LPESSSAAERDRARQPRFGDWGYRRLREGDVADAATDQPDDRRRHGTAHSIEDLVRLAFNEVGIENWRDYVRQDPKFFRRRRSIC